MLQQILRDMYVDPEILAGLDESQKQTLFCKMREEQLRRWRIWEAGHTEKLSADIDRDTSKSKKHVQFLQDANNEPWVWIMGEHPDDISIEEILAEEAKQKALKLAELETKELRKTVEAELSDIFDYNNHIKIISNDISSLKIDDFDIYCSVDELHERINNSKTITTTFNRFKQIQNSNTKPTYHFNNNDNLKSKDFEYTKTTQRVASRVAHWEQRLIGEKTSEILKRMQKNQEAKEKEAEENAKVQEELWQEQERKAKEAEIKIRDIARRAREEHRKSVTLSPDTDVLIINNNNSTYINNNNLNNMNNNNSLNNNNSTIKNNQSNNIYLVNYNSPPISLETGVSRPPNQEAVVKWYKEEEFPKKSGLETDAIPAKWFHGILSRAEAENLLQLEPGGTFLVRISEKIWGYAISYKDKDRCKHYLIDTSNGKYQFLGANQLSHTSLNDLIQHHCHQPITQFGNELLQRPCPSNLAVPKIFIGLI